MDEARGYLSIILHAHLPFVRHPEYENFLEEHWLFEAITETYIPLLRVFERLENDGVGYNAVMSLSPTLVSMLEDPLLQERYLARTYKLLNLTDNEINRNKNNPELLSISKWYHNFFLETIDFFENKYQCRLAQAFAKIASHGNLELMTCGATHGFLPLLKNDPGAVKAQIHTASDYHKEVFGVQSSGIWLPECAYFPGVDEVVKEAGFSFFILDTHGIENASHEMPQGVYKPLFCPSGIAAFARDKESGKQVWSAEEGYPGNPVYREFYRDLGFDRDLKYLKGILVDDKIRSDTGIKYYRITGRDDKEIYNPQAAFEKACEDAGNFLTKRQQQVEHLNARHNSPPIIVAPYDAELFGHWWFEGPIFLDILLRKIHYDQDIVKTTTPLKFLQKYPKNDVAVPNPSSWGGEGYFEFWCSDCNKWVYPLLNNAARVMNKTANEFKNEEISPIQRRVLDQAARELLLSQASDWPFIMRTGTSPEYATKRVKDHLARFQTLIEMLKNNNIQAKTLSAIEYVDNVFPNINPFHFA